jgi:hypothetical protein
VPVAGFFTPFFMKTSYGTVWAVFLLLAGLSGGALAQVSIAPTTLYTDANGISTFYISNPSPEAQEVSVSFVFGYPAYNENGELYMVYEDSDKEAFWGLGSRLRVFPRSFILAPNNQQVVRIQVLPDRSKPDGMYFSRVKISSNVQAADVGAQSAEGVAMRVNFKFDQILAVFHRQGTATTSLKLGVTDYVKDGNKLYVTSDFTREGNAPYIGSVHAVLRDPQSLVVAEQIQTVALYFDARHRVTLELPEDLIRGDYILELEYRTERGDVSASNLVQGPPVRKRLQVSLSN